MPLFSKSHGPTCPASEIDGRRSQAAYRGSLPFFAKVTIGAVFLCATLAIGMHTTRAQSQGAGGSQAIQADPAHPALAIGAAAPDFALPGVDGKTHKLSDYAKAKVLAVVFQCNTCPVSQLYEGRIEKLFKDYSTKGVALVAINPNNPDSVRLDEESYSDVTDSLDDMKARAEFRHFDYPYLYDGEKQTVAMKYGPTATPEIFIFDQSRKLQYRRPH